MELQKVAGHKERKIFDASTEDVNKLVNLESEEL